MGENFKISYTYMLAVRKPIIAAINGPCAGLGFCYALLCDMRFAEKQAKFTTAFGQRGLIAEHAQLASASIDWLGKALDLLWSARSFQGEEAKELGLVERSLIQVSRSMLQSNISNNLRECLAYVFANYEGASLQAFKYGAWRSDDRIKSVDG